MITYAMWRTLQRAASTLVSMFFAQNSSRIPNCISRARPADVILPNAGDATFTTAAG